MVALGRRAPEGSVTVPWISPEEPIPWEYAKLLANTKHTTIHASDFIGFSFCLGEDIAAVVLNKPICRSVVWIARAPIKEHASRPAGLGYIQNCERDLWSQESERDSQIARVSIT